MTLTRIFTLIATLAQVIMTPIGRIAAIPWRILTGAVTRFYRWLNEHPKSYQQVSRSLAGGVLSGVGNFIGVTIVGNILLLQALGLVGMKPWPLEQMAFFVGACTFLGFAVGYGMFKMPPGLIRFVLGGLSGFALSAAAAMFLRWMFNYVPWESGPIFMLTAFPIAFASMWGMGGFKRENMDLHLNIESRAHPKAEEPNLGAFDGIKFHVALFKFWTTRIWANIKPLIGPAVLVLVVVGGVISAIVVAGAFAPITRTQTYDQDAAATSISGFVEGVKFFGQPVSKFVFFLLVAGGLLSAVGGTALIFALIFNALGVAVKEARADKKKPLDLTERGGLSNPFAKLFQFGMKFLKFNVDFAMDAVNWVAGLFGVRAAR